MPPRNREDRQQITLEDHRIIYKNFKGKEGPFNREGDRNFSVLLNDKKLIRELERDGWNIKYLTPREEGDEPQAHMQVSVSFRNVPPQIYMITARGRVKLSEREVEVLDFADYETVDIIVRPYHWEVSGKSGIKAYLKSMYVRVLEDDLDLKYQDIEDVPTRSGKTYDS